eukprot:NODE_1925_length_1354_cov_43.606130_g1744_i0.p1 GENE.NODE_1925_length_1354_cov_43.606130_g1744_i0~~NODE_1925_length_1354_cov_43.606130_g1744_i0.p1  ORF type:complete len:416 (-),score=67.34 NODE_1925_length_1354_cov_43.606130_g1744_i0:105-1274(-)
MSMPLPDVKRARREFCRLNGADDPEGTVALSKIQRRGGTFLGWPVSLESDPTLPDLLRAVYPSIPRTVLLQYASTEITEKLYQRLKVGFNKLDSSGSGVVSLKQWAEPRKLKPKHVRWHTHAWLGDVRLDPTCLKTVEPVRWGACLESIFLSVPRFRVSRYLKSYSLFETLENPSQEALRDAASRPTRLRWHPLYQPPSAPRLNAKQLEATIGRLTKKGRGQEMREQSDWLQGNSELLHPPRPMTDEEQEECVFRVYQQALDDVAERREALEQKVLESESAVLRPHEAPFESIVEMEESTARLHGADPIRRSEKLAALRENMLVKPVRTVRTPTQVQGAVLKLGGSDVKKLREHRRELEERFHNVPLFPPRRLPEAAIRASMERLCQTR